MSFSTYKIGQLGRVVTGRTPPAANPELFGTAHPFITPSDIQGDVRYLATDRHLSDLGMEVFHRVVLPTNAVCVVCIGATIGKLCMASVPSVSNQQINSIIVDPERFDAHFVFNALRPKVDELKSKASGAATPILNKSNFEDLEIGAPDLPVQQRIGAILSAYDDLIEVNQRRIAILEEMARRLFEEWFVRFRYPGHEAVPLVESDLGPIPQGWEPVAADILINFDPKTKVPKEGMKRFVPMGALSTSNSVIEGWETRNGNAGAKFANGDTLFARITPCLENGKTGLVNFLNEEETAFGSTEFVVMRAKLVPPEFVYLLARSEAFRAVAIKSMGGADGRQRARPEALSGFRLARPDGAIVTKFGSLVEPMFRQIRLLADQKARLRTARDLLLPKLISGEIEVGTAETALAEAAE